MKIAYLISAYKDPSHLRRLISALSHGVEDTVSFFIHIDAKVDIRPFIDKCNGKNVYYTDTRYWVQWGGYSQVMYQMELLSLSLNNKCSFDRFVLITGQDYPLVSNEIMMKAYNEMPNKQYIKGLDKTLYHRKSHHEFTLYHFFRDTKFRNPKVKQMFSFGFRLLFLLLPVRKKPYVICNNQKWHIWQSSSYMSLTRDCAKFVLSEMQNNRTLIRYCKYSYVPEEKMIPTIIFNSKYKEYAMVSEFKGYRGLINLSALEEFCYGKEIKVFQEDDYEHLVTSNKFFCRKVETGKSDKLMELLDKHNGYCYRELEWQDSKCHSQPYSQRTKYQRTAESSVREMPGGAT